MKTESTPSLASVVQSRFVRRWWLFVGSFRDSNKDVMAALMATFSVDVAVACQLPSDEISRLRDEAIKIHRKLGKYYGFYPPNVNVDSGLKALDVLRLVSDSGDLPRSISLSVCSDNSLDEGRSDSSTKL
jgi:hypothetical protein